MPHVDPCAFVENLLTACTVKQIHAICRAWATMIKFVEIYGLIVYTELQRVKTYLHLIVLNSNPNVIIDQKSLYYSKFYADSNA